MDLYSDVILPSLYDAGYSTTDILEYFDKDYIVTYNPLVDDINTKSAMIFKETGIMKLLNGTVENSIGDNLTTVTLTTWLRGIKCKLQHYISYVFFELDYRMYFFSEYQRYVGNKLLSIPQKYNFQFEEIRKQLYKKYILDIDILNVNQVSMMSIIKKEPVQKPKKLKSSSEIQDCNEVETDAIEKYIDSRALSKLSIKKTGKVTYASIIVNGVYRNPALCFHYEEGFYKYRIIFERDKKYRFRSNGTYKNFFIARKNNTKKLYIVEGEIEALSILDYIEDDVFAIHNTNSLPSNLSLIDGYDEIVVKIDKDRYEENKKAFDKLSRTIVDYKVDHAVDDYNDLLIKNKLTKEIIEKINR